MTEGMPGSLRDKYGPRRFVNERHDEESPDGMDGTVDSRGQTGGRQCPSLSG